MQNVSQQADPAGGGLPASAVLASAPLFASFSAGELAFLAERSEFLELEAGQRVFEPGDRADRLYLVESGTVDILSPEGGSVLAEFVVGDSFGELELLTGAERNAAARAESRARLLAFPSGGADLKEALSGRPEVAAGILRSFLLVIAGRTRKANALVKENSPWVRELQRQAYGDKLTGLLNRAYLEENLPKAIGSPDSPSPLALVMMKPDNFKEINDSFGHEAGDAALVLMAGELEKAVGAEGTAVRYMGNELAVVYPGKDRAAALETAASLQARIQALDLSCAVGSSGLRLSLSLGIALCPGHGTEAEALIKAAAGLPLEGRARGGSLVLFPEDVA